MKLTLEIDKTEAINSVGSLVSTKINGYEPSNIKLMARKKDGEFVEITEFKFVYEDSN